MRGRFIAGVMAGIALTVGGTVWAVADGNPATDNVRRVVPYDGILERDGLAVHGPHSLRFALYSTDEAAGGTLPDTPLWSEEWSNLGSKSCTAADCRVTVRTGRFSVQLGRHADIMPTIQNADDVCIAISVRGPSAWVPLGGCQHIVPAPHALWAASGSNPHIAGALTVVGQLEAGSVRTTGAVNAGSVEATGTVRAATVLGTNAVGGGTISASGLVTGPIVYGSNYVRAVNGYRVGNGGVYRGNTRPTSNDLGLYSSTSGAWNRYVTNGGQHAFFVDSATNLSGQSPVFVVKADGDVRAYNGMQVDGRITLDDRDITWTEVSGGNTWGSWRGKTTCPTGQYVCGLEQRVEGSQGGDDDTSVNDIRIACCTLGD